MKNNTVKSIVMDTVRKQLLLSLVLIISVVLSVGFSLLPPLILERIVDVLSENRDFDYYLALFYFLTVCFSGIGDSSKEVIITVFGQKVTHSIRSALSVKLNFLPSSYYVKNESGVTSSIFVNDVNTVENLFSSGIISMICDLIKLVAIIIIIFTRSVGLGIILIIVTPFVFYLTRVFQKCMLKAQSDNRRAIANINQQIPDAINCMRTIHLLNGEDFMLKRYGKSIDLSYDAQERSNFYDSVYSPIIVSISAFLIGLVMAFSAQSGTIRFFFGMSAGSAAAIIAYIGNFFTPLENIGMEIQNIQSAIAGIKRIDSFLNESEEVKTEAEHHEYCSAVEIKDIDFSYDKNSQLIFEGFSLNIEEGETVVIAGRTGRGKSTLLKLISGLYKPETGYVRVFGLSPDCIEEKDRRKIFGYVEQQFSLIPGTVADQVSLGDNDVDRKEVLDALKLTGLLEKVNGLKNGLETLCGEELFSKGEFQLLSIARAIVKNPKLLLLDEITANLDSKTEEMILKAIREASKNRTVISVSHRLFNSESDVRYIDL